MALCRKNLAATRPAPHKVHAGLPRGARCGLFSRLRSRPPARHRRGRSPLNQPTRDHADGATLGRRDANASQRPRRPVSKESPATATGNPANPKLSALSRKRPTNFNNTDGQAGSPPPQYPPNLVWNRHRGRPGHAKNRAPTGCRAWLCAGRTSRRRIPPRTRSMPGSLGERDAVCSPGYEAGRRRAIGVVAALSINPRATTPMVRRWVAGTPMRHSGPEGRC